MSDYEQLVSKVLVLDGATVSSETLRALCEEYSLVPIRPQQSGVSSVMGILESNIDLGGILLYENYGGQGEGLRLARAIRESRPELPIFLRRERISSMAGLGEKDAGMFRCAYTFAELNPLRVTLEASIFNRVYPTALVRGITEMTKSSLSALLSHCDIEVEAPYLVKDRIIYGEVFTLISIESGWCRGYMMLQASEEEFLRLIPLNKEGASSNRTFRELNSVLGEATNMIWGAFKNRYTGNAGTPALASQIQVPIVINHQRRFISFGSEDPQLCLKYTVSDRTAPENQPVSVYQRFIFNLSWTPEEMTETSSLESMIESGQLEVFGAEDTYPSFTN